MTPKQVRSTLRHHFNAIGFAEEGSRFVYRTDELMHTVEVSAVRRLAGTVQMHHEVCAPTVTGPTLTEELASYGHASAYPRIWSASSIDPALVLEQVTAIQQSFQTLNDLRHHFSDREAPEAENWPTARGGVGEASSLSAAETSGALHALAQAVLSPAFSPQSEPTDFELWVSQQENANVRHCAYLEANTSSTLAVVVLFTLAAPLIADGLHTDAAVRALMAAPKQVLQHRGRPLLLRLTRAQTFDAAPARAAWAEQLAVLG